MTETSWQDYMQELAARLLRLDDGDTIILRHGKYYSQCQMAEDWLHVDAVSNHHLPQDQQLSAEQEEQLLAMGWLPPDPPNYFNWYVEPEAPLSAQDGARLAEMMVRALRDVYGIDRVDLLEKKEFNALY